jgi:murein L,D-transpeptidase YcbB/YkuD
MGTPLIGERVKRLRTQCTGHAPVHFFPKLWGAAAGMLLAVAPLSWAHAAPAPSQATVRAGQGIDDFYRARKGAPLWLSPAAGDGATQLLSLLGSANLDGLDPGKYQVGAIRQALDRARSGKPNDVQAADRMLSDAFVAYVTDLRSDPGLNVLYVDPSLKPAPPSPLAALLGASNAPSLGAYVRQLGWMNPIYAELRHALTEHEYSDDHQRQLLEVNLERARTLPAGKQRYIIVNAAQQRLYTYEDGRQVDSMVVVVGKPKYPTPMMTAYIRFASLNPYWFVPPDLAAERIAPRVLKRGLKYLDNLGYQVLSDWSADADIIDPKTIDWKAVADGKQEVLIRQLPGPHNSMGRMKFMFPNSAGVYLHDNPERELFTEASRLYSGGCVRLEDAPRLGRWLFGHDLDWKDAGTEQMEPLASPVPVYITYLTAMPNAEGTSIAYSDDVYGRDAERLATLQSSTGAVASASR